MCTVLSVRTENRVPLSPLWVTPRRSVLLWWDDGMGRRCSLTFSHSPCGCPKETFLAPPLPSPTTGGGWGQAVQMWMNGGRDARLGLHAVWEVYMVYELYMLLVIPLQPLNGDFKLPTFRGCRGGGEWSLWLARPYGSQQWKKKHIKSAGKANVHIYFFSSTSFSRVTNSREPVS